MQREPGTQFHPVVHVLVGAACAYAGHRLHWIGIGGSDSATLWSWVLGLFALMSTIKGLRLWAHKRRVDAIMKEASKPSDAHGTTNWGSRKDAKKAGLL